MPDREPKRLTIRCRPGRPAFTGNAGLTKTVHASRGVASMRTTLTLKVAAAVACLVLVSVATVVTTQTVIAVRLARSEAFSKTEEMAQRNAETVKSDLQKALETAKTLRGSFEGMKKNKTTSRKIFNEILASSLETSPDLAAVWTCWEPNALDDNDDAYAGAEGHDKTGRFVPCWTRENGKAALRPLQQYDTPGAGDYYLLARASGEETVVEPRLAGYGKDLCVTSLVVPIHHGGKVVGAVGVDVPLQRFQSLCETIRPYETGCTLLVSNRGLIAAHSDVREVGRKIGENPEHTELKASIEQGEAKTVFDRALGQGALSHCVFVPLSIGASKTPWSLATVAPVQQIVSNATRMAWWAALVGVAVCAISTFVAWWLASRLVRPIRACMESVAALAGQDFGKKCRVQSRDELGQMAEAINRSIDATEKAFLDVKQAAQREADATAERIQAERRQAEEARLKREEQEENDRRLAAEERNRREEQERKDQKLAEEERRRTELLRGKVAQLLEVVNAAAQGDLTRQVTVEGNEAVDELAAGIGRMLSNLAQMIGQVTESAEPIHRGLARDRGKFTEPRPRSADAELQRRTDDRLHRTTDPQRGRSESQCRGCRTRGHRGQPIGGKRWDGGEEIDRVDGADPRKLPADQRDHSGDLGDRQPNEPLGTQCRHRGRTCRRTRHGLCRRRRRGPQTGRTLEPGRARNLLPHQGVDEARPGRRSIER